MQVRAKEENQRSRDMNSALAAFVEGKSDSADWWHSNARSKDNVSREQADTPMVDWRGSRIRTPSERLPLPSQATGSHLDDPTSAGYFGPIGEEANPPNNGLQSPLNSHVGQGDQSLGSPRPSLQRNTESASTGNSASYIKSPPATEDANVNDLPTKVRATATRAAGLIQKGIGADGVLFLDATAGSTGGVIDSTQGLSQTETETDGSLISDNNGKHVRPLLNQTGDAASIKKSSAPPRDSVILGSAYSADIETRVKLAIEQAKISEKVLKSLLRRYPNGQIWHFNADGDASDEDDEDETIHESQSTAYAAAPRSAGSDHEPKQSKTPTTKRATKRARARKRDGRAIQAIFPGIRSLVFLGMWDPHQERWFGASIAVSYSSMRIFSAQHELSYVAAFCDVVLAEIGRLEAQELGRSKNDFVSSISHELRSPLGMVFLDFGYARLFDTH